MKVVMVDGDSKADAQIWRFAHSCHYKSQNANTPISAGSDKFKETAVYQKCIGKINAGF